nr:hypothetical protein [Anaerolineae bacterium]
AAGLVLRSRPASAGELDPGEQAVLELTNGLAVAGAGHPYVVYSERRAGDESDSIVVAS